MSTRKRQMTLGQLLMVLFGGAFFGYALVTFISDQLLAGSGLHTSGVVIDKKGVRQTKGSDDYYPIVKFTANDGAIQQFTGPSSKYPPTYPIDQKVDVLYDPNNPTNAQIYGADTRLLLVAGVFGLVFIIYGVADIIQKWNRF